MDPLASSPSNSFRSADRSNNLFVALDPSSQIYHKKQQSLPQQIPGGPNGLKPIGGPPNEGRYRVPWIDMVPRRDIRGRRVKKIALQNQTPGHIQPNPKTKNPTTMDTSHTSREARGRESNHYDIPLIGKSAFLHYLFSSFYKISRAKYETCIQISSAILAAPHCK